MPCVLASLADGYTLAELVSVRRYAPVRSKSRDAITDCTWLPSSYDVSSSPVCCSQSPPTDALSRINVHGVGAPGTSWLQSRLGTPGAALARSAICFSQPAT